MQFLWMSLTPVAAKLTDLAVRNAKPMTKKYKLSAGNGLISCN